MKALIPVGPLVGKMMGQPPNLRELISSADGVTFWASYEKAKRVSSATSRARSSSGCARRSTPRVACPPAPRPEPASISCLDARDRRRCTSGART